MSAIAQNLASIRNRMGEACARAGREPRSVQLVGVTKTVSVDRIRSGVEAGISVLGENYIQEARHKREALADLKVSWHFIGHLQSNKAKMAVEWFDLIHTVDRSSLAAELDRQARKRGKEIPVLLQVNVGDEESKSGVSVDELPALYRSIRGLDGLKIRGLMTLPPYVEDAEQARPYFRLLRECLGRLRQEAARPQELVELSMGMSHDYQVAIEEGATLVRIGTSLFGARPA